MLSTATTSNQYQPNFWFPGNPLPSFFSSSTGDSGLEKNLYFQQQTSESNDFLLSTRSNSNLTQFNYIQHPSSNNFLQRDDWSQPTWSKGMKNCSIPFFLFLCHPFEREKRRRLLHTYILMVIQ